MKCNELKTRKINDRGITVVALVVTMIILIILATITVNMAFGENGLLTKARESRTEQSEKIKSSEKSLKELKAEYESISRRKYRRF